jgi:hypothetical protein
MPKPVGSVAIDLPHRLQIESDVVGFDNPLTQRRILRVCCSLWNPWHRLLMKEARVLPGSHQQAGSCRSGIALFAQAVAPEISA